MKLGDYIKKLCKKKGLHTVYKEGSFDHRLSTQVKSLVD